MSDIRFRIRPSAAIIRDGAILLIEYDEPGKGLHYNLPGGGLQPEELIYDGLRRELREEAGVEATIGPLLLVWELPGGIDGPNHHIGLVFRCALAGDNQPFKPEPGDDWQIGVRWVPLADLHGVWLLPELMARKLAEVLETPAAVDPFVYEQW